MVLLAGFSFKTVLVTLRFIILIYGICLGGGKSSKDTTRYYDKKEEKPLIHAARTIDPNYTPKGSGYYKDKNGPPMAICKENDHVIDPEYIENVCRNNCQSCSMYRGKYGLRPPQQIPQQKSGSSSGGFGIVLIIVAAVVVTKLMGLW